MSHYIRTIQTSFTSGLPSSSSSTSSAWASSSPYSLPTIMNQYPPGLTPDWRGPSGSSGPNTYNTHTTKRRSLRALTSVHRRPAPPPPTTKSPRSQPTSTTYMKFDPFADENTPDLLSLKPSSTTLSTPVIYHTSPRYRLTSLPSSYTYSTTHIPAAAPERSKSRSSADKEARAKLVAGILLNRAQVGKPPRRRSFGEPKTYIKSGLSSVVSVEA